ncbi:MAG: Hsp20/alpha crystallin family protein [Magnetococcales bacterium]|nr:Hsp20/alpha crystallin family protein [Magnetococcales bacterium]
MLNMSCGSTLAGCGVGSVRPIWNVPSAPYGLSSTASPMSIRTDILEDHGKITFSIDVPGIHQKDLRVTIEPGCLSIRGIRYYSHRKNNPFRRKEWASGAFLRTFHLQDGLLLDKTKASVRRGVLTVMIPKSDEAKPRQIMVHDDTHVTRTVRLEKRSWKAVMDEWWGHAAAKINRLFGKR